MDYKRTYNPEVEGYGDPAEWRAAFSYRMGIDKAREAMNEGKWTPWEVLGIAQGSIWEVIKKAHRKLVMEFHPDRNPGDKIAEANFRRVQAAFEILEHMFKK